MAETTTKARRAVEMSGALEPSQGELIPADVATEIAQIQRQPARTIAVVAASDVRAAQNVREALMDASIKVTFATDWVVFQGGEGADVAFLQDIGCQRIKPIWGISFKKMDMSKDITVDELEDGNVWVSAMAEGNSLVTNEDALEIGGRGSSSFFEKAWSRSLDKPVERAKAITDIKKAAMANARGRVVRSLSGTNQVPVARLHQAGLDVKMLRGAKMQTGTKGGSGTGAGASKPQLQKIVGLALKQSKVQTIETFWGDHFGSAVDWLMANGKNLTGGSGTASVLIEKMLNLEEGEQLTVEVFEKAIGAKLEALD